MSKLGGLGFFKATKARQAGEAIARAEALIAVLQLEDIDLTAPEALIRSSKQWVEDQDYGRALEAARLAERIALHLETEFLGYAKAMEALQTRMEEVRRYGITDEAMEAAVSRAEERVSIGVWEEAFKVPDYASARGIAEKAEAEGKALVERAASASNAVFMAELAIEALVGVPGPKDRDVFESGSAEALQSALEGATRRLALRDYDQAARVAKDIEARATRLRAEFIEATETLAATSTLLGDHRTRGAAIGRLGSQIAITRGVLHRGVIEPAVGMARRLLADARTLGDAFGKATAAIGGLTNRYSALVREGHLSATADRAILDARRSIRDGDYGIALRHLEEAETAITRAETEREALRKSLAERRGRVAGSSAPFFGEAQEILGRAEQSFKEGDYSSSNEDLVLATLLLGTVSPKTGPAKN